MEKTIWIGMDVHAASIAVATYVDQEKTGSVRQIPNEPKVIRRTISRLKEEGTLHACYEAGPCGYQLYRQLGAMGVDCAVVAPALIPRRPGDRIKTDRRDAEKLVRLYRAGELVSITVPTQEQEAARDLLRARDDTRRDRTAARHRLDKFLLRHGRTYGAGTRWTDGHWKWIRSHKFSGPQQIVFEHYCDQVDALSVRLAALDREVQELAATPVFKPIVSRLCCLRGLSILSAMVIVTEVYDLRRFKSPRELMAYLGLVPSEQSSGDRTKRGRITKTGNAHVRRILVEAAWAYRHAPQLSVRVRRLLVGQPPEVAAIARKALLRLSKKYGRLVSRGKRAPVACTAVARELCGFVWAMGTLPQAL